MDYTFSVPDDLCNLLAEELQQLSRDLTDYLGGLRALQYRLQILSTVPETASDMARAYLAARDGEEPAPGCEVGEWPCYRQPLGAHDAYPEGYVIQEGGHLFRATRYGVVHSPSAWPGDWEDVTEELAETPPPILPGADPWVAGEAVEPPMLREYEGVVYECTMSHTTQTDWIPPVVPNMWSVARPA